MIGIDSPNRIEKRAELIRGIIATGHRPDGQPLGDIAKLDADLALSVLEFFQYQEIKSRAQLMGTITTDEALTVYAALGDGVGSNGGWAKGTDVAMKVAVTSLIGELVGI